LADVFIFIALAIFFTWAQLEGVAILEHGENFTDAMLRLPKMLNQLHVIHGISILY